MKVEVLGALVCEDHADYEGKSVEITVLDRKLSFTFARRVR